MAKWIQNKKLTTFTRVVLLIALYFVGGLTQLPQQLADAQNATETSSDSVKAGFAKAWDATTNSFTEGRHWVSDKITP